MTHYVAHSKNSATSMLAFIAGAAAGITAGVLLAPKSGRETRMQVKDKVQQAREKAMQAARDEKQIVQDKVQDISEGAQELKQHGQEAAQQVRERVAKSRRKDSSDPEQML